MRTPSHLRIVVFVAVLASLLGSSLPAMAGSSTDRPRIAGCGVFPGRNVWNRRVDHLPVHPHSRKIRKTVGLDRPLHPDFGSFSGYGIPFNIVDRDTTRSELSFRWPDESDSGPYPIPPDPRIEGGSDRHMLMLERDSCKLYELYAVEERAGGSWYAQSGAIWKLASNRLRPRGWTSADAAGLPILPGLVRYKEVAAGHIRHALRFTAPQTRDAFIYPARHEASSLTATRYPPMGLRVRLKSSVKIKSYPRQARIVLKALKRYGMILADNGSAWYVTGAPDPRWDDDALHSLHGITGADLEVVDTRKLRNPT
jgi:hypothetical protein